jgi:hypothetical protein
MCSQTLWAIGAPSLASTIVDSTHPLSGCTWNSNDGTVCPQANLTLDHVYVKGGLLWQGNGTITITNSIIEVVADSLILLSPAIPGRQPSI